MRRFEPGDIVIYKRNNLELRCLVITYVSNNVFERKYTIKSLDKLNNIYPKYTDVRWNQINICEKSMREKKIDNLLND